MLLQVLSIHTLITFGLGLLVDLMSAMYLRAVSAKKPGLAAIIAGFMTLFGYYVWYITQNDNSMMGIFTYAIGAGVGTYIGLVTHEADKTSEPKR